MLVLEMKVRDTVLIDGGKIAVTLLVKGRDGTVKLGFDAPKEVVIDRRKVHVAREASKRREAWEAGRGAEGPSEGGAA